jgi:transcriptional regulator with XRE-family HTH domain
LKKSLRSKEQLVLQQLLAKARKETGLSQSALAKKLDKPQSFVSKYEIGERRLDMIEVFHICQALGISFSDFSKKMEKNLLNHN